MNVEQLTHAAIGAAIVVHRELGPGLLESAYERCFFVELTTGGFHVERQKAIPITYKGVKLDCGYRLDLLVEGVLILEIKAVEKLIPIHDAQMMTHLRLAKCTVGLIINFNVPVLKNGIRRIVNGFDERTRYSWRLGGE